MRLLMSIIAVPVIAMFGGIGWHHEQGRAANAAADEFEKWMMEQRIIQVEFIVSPPQATPEGESLYLCGRAPVFGGLNPAGVKLVRSSDGKYRATIELLSGIQQTFFVTRGSYASIEADPVYGAPQWRSEIIAGRDPIELTVHGWADDVPRNAARRGGGSGDACSLRTVLPKAAEGS